MNKNKCIIIIFAFLLIYCNKLEKRKYTLEDIMYRLGPDFLKENMEYIIDIDFKDNSAIVYKIFTGIIMSDNFSPDFAGFDSFKITELFFYGNEEYLEKYNKYWDDNFSNYMDQYKNQGIDSSSDRMEMFYESLYNEIGKRPSKDVYIAHSKDDLDFIESKYISSEHFREIDSIFFDNNILVLIVVNHNGRTYPKNWKIIKFNEKYIFKVEIWDQDFDGWISNGNTTLFLIKIEK
jgi:hypothetical protein